MKTIPLILLTGLLAGCASGPDIVSNVTPGTDFTRFATFNFHEPLGTDRANGMRTPMSTRLMASMENEMRARGLTRSDDPDLLIDFLAWTEDRVDVRQTPTTTVHRSYWHRGFSTWPTYQTTVRQYTQGSLVIDLLDPRAGILVAEGGAQQRVNNDQMTQERADELVAEVMRSIWAN